MRATLLITEMAKRRETVDEKFLRLYHLARNQGVLKNAAVLAEDVLGTSRTFAYDLVNKKKTANESHLSLFEDYLKAKGLEYEDWLEFDKKENADLSVKMLEMLLDAANSTIDAQEKAIKALEEQVKFLKKKSTS